MIEDTIIGVLGLVIALTALYTSREKIRIVIRYSVDLICRIKMPRPPYVAGATSTVSVDTSDRKIDT